MASLTDMRLVAQVAMLHDKKAFNALVVKYQEPVRRFFLNHTLGDEQLSDDLAQDTFLKVYTHITQFKGTASFSTWLYSIAYRVFCDYARSKKKTADWDDRLMERRSEGLGVRSLRLDIYTALSYLKEEECTCITLQLMDGLPIDKISEITGMPMGTVKSHLSRGKDKLTNYLKQNGYDDQ